MYFSLMEMNIEDIKGLIQERQSCQGLRLPFLMYHYSVFFCSPGLESHAICILLMAEWHNALAATSHCLALLRFGFIVINLNPTSCSSKLEVFSKQREGGGGRGGTWQFARQQVVGALQPGSMILVASAARPLRTPLVPSEFGYIRKKKLFADAQYFQKVQGTWSIQYHPI